MEDEDQKGQGLNTPKNETTRTREFCSEPLVIDAHELRNAPADI